MVQKIQPKIPGSEAKISRFVSKQLPAYFSEIESLMIPFLRAYYEWMEVPEGITYDIKSLLEYQNPNKTPERFMKFFVEEYLSGFPADIMADKRLLIQYAKDFYRTRGSEQSFKFLFRVLYNEDVTVYYPKNDIFRTSDAKWIVRNVIKLTAFDEEIEELVNRKIYGVDSAAVALVESVSIQYVGPEKIAYVVISNRYGDFQIDEAITTTSESDDIPLIFARILGSVSSATITSPGTGYITGTTIPISSNGDGTGVFAIVDTVDINGGILKIRVIDGGINYVTIPPTPDIPSMAGTGAVFTFNIAGNFTEAGYFVDDACMLSSTKKLQDGKLYQEYSYVLKSKVPLEKFSDAVKRLIHPAGMYMASEMVLTQPPDDQESEVLNIMFHLTQPEAINYIDPETSRRLFVEHVLIRGSVPSARSVDEVDDTYPDGIPGEVSFYRLFGPEFLTVLPALDESWVELISAGGDGYFDAGYIDDGYTE